jgi:hypothetical protein
MPKLLEIAIQEDNPESVHNLLNMSRPVPVDVRNCKAETGKTLFNFAEILL